MGPHVPSQVVRPRERLATRLTDVRLLPRMRPHVPRQVAGSREGFAARLKYVRPLP
jgi:hypothetical protein